ncbi:hypothetical protein CSV69_10195 [Sporosarcina sp. P26b]|uniref:DUF927 domain-containing protein n=1 Tax=Sporosarcina sp. P26b TaxID=2048253 RepID=UPI000C1708D9|nr:DUF927 domain-containing protein [Sporosarcina sp. P26b]PIC95701.1 hypothetical protein CSV69_10195 [Sporosarcina sp. P26b]
MMRMKEIQNYELINREDAKTLPSINKTFKLGKYRIEGTRLFYEDIDPETGKDVKHTISQLVWIDCVIHSLETGSTTFEVIFYAREQYHRVVVSRAIFIEKNILQLTEKGADIKMTNYKNIVGFLEKQSKEIKKTFYKHSSLGWKQSGDSLVYYHDQSIAANGSPEEFSSTYNGGLAIQPTGSFEAWQKVIIEQVLGKTPLEFALVYGFSAVINALLAKYRPMDVLLVHIYGDSSTGKTTASRLAVSGFGKPDADGLLKNWNATFNALMKIIASNHGVPMVLDESSTKTNADFTSIIYQLAEGRDKNRLNAEIEVREQQKWSGAYLSTGEHRLTEKSNQNSGLQVRVPEFGNIEWTDSATHAEIIKNELGNNYGHAGQKFVQHVIDNFEENLWLEAFDEVKANLVDAMENKDGFSERLADKYAVIVFTAHIMNECFDFEVSIDKLQEFILEVDQENMTTRSLETRALDYIQQKVITDQASFNKDGSNFTGVKCCGSIKKKEDYLEVAIIRNVFDDWLEEGKFSSKQVVLKGLKKEGILDHETGKNTRERKLPDKNENQSIASKKTVYVLKMPLDLLDAVNTDSPEIEKKKRTPLKTPNSRPDIQKMIKMNLEK